MTMNTFGDPAYVSLTTFRRTGVAVAVPVWCAHLDGTYYVFSAGNAGKVKRLRNDPRVRLAKCDFNGKVEGEAFDGRGSIVTDVEGVQRALTALRKKYGWQMWLADVGARLTFKMNKRAYLAIQLQSN